VAGNEQHHNDSAGLRERADALRRKQSADRLNASRDGADIPLAEGLNLVHELEVHQIELEMQNDEWRRTQDELATSRARYFDLYDLAPVGYLTLSDKGLILEANLTAANLLALERSQLVRQPLFRFILPEDQDVYYLHRKRLSVTLQPQACELRMVRGACALQQRPGFTTPGFTTPGVWDTRRRSQGMVVCSGCAFRPLSRRAAQTRRCGG
jgi:PAS domain-containing protein